MAILYIYIISSNFNSLIPSFLRFYRLYCSLVAQPGGLMSSFVPDLVWKLCATYCVCYSSRRRRHNSDSGRERRTRRAITAPSTLGSWRHQWRHRGTRHSVDTARRRRHTGRLWTGRGCWACRSQPGRHRVTAVETDRAREKNHSRLCELTNCHLGRRLHSFCPHSAQLAQCLIWPPVRPSVCHKSQF